MSLKTYKPTTPTRRHTVAINTKHIVSGNKPNKRMLRVKTNSGGRNNSGKVTMRHQGGAVKSFYRIIDFKRERRDIAGTVTSIEYDPNRTSYIVLVTFPDGIKTYYLAWEGSKVGESVQSGEKAEIKNGNSLPLVNIPAGTIVHNIEIVPGNGAKMVRSAGQSAVLQGFNGKGYAQLKLPSTEVRLINEKCYATIGTVSNSEHVNEKIGGAGRRRRKGVRPSVRGMAMHAQAHPHGGGEGKGVVGGPTQDIYGNYRGLKTRKPKRTSNKFIISRRKKKNK